jgi:hypothetical protein
MGNAASAEAMAASTSSTVQQGTSASNAPVLESVTGIHLSVFDSSHSPFIQYFFLSTISISLRKNHLFHQLYYV